MKQNRKTIITFICAAVLAASVTACARTFTGRVAVKGHEPFTYLALVTDTGDLKIVGALKKKLWENYQGRRIIVKGTITNQSAGVLLPPELEVAEIVSTEP